MTHAINHILFYLFPTSLESIILNQNQQLRQFQVVFSSLRLLNEVSYATAIGCIVHPSAPVCTMHSVQWIFKPPGNKESGLNSNGNASTSPGGLGDTSSSCRQDTQVRHAHHSLNYY